ncbi:hypothetical protein FH972_024104 [Carpinus fangiana]|uniref:Uncharacterized protein n=1 Tax=Carpinus fangiana TaxID=176857 RepID=A0A5N6KXH2_9ROSI|nr:hypothetical protein FH972_024104 [Carpinus fangiana]
MLCDIKQLWTVLRRKAFLLITVNCVFTDSFALSFITIMAGLQEDTETAIDFCVVKLEATFTEDVTVRMKSKSFKPLIRTCSVGWYIEMLHIYLVAIEERQYMSNEAQPFDQLLSWLDDIENTMLGNDVQHWLSSTSHSIMVALVNTRTPDKLQRLKASTMAIPDEYYVTKLLMGLDLDEEDRLLPHTTRVNYSDLDIINTKVSDEASGMNEGPTTKESAQLATKSDTSSTVGRSQSPASFREFSPDLSEARNAGSEPISPLWSETSNHSAPTRRTQISITGPRLKREDRTLGKRCYNCGSMVQTKNRHGQAPIKFDSISGKASGARKEATAAFTHMGYFSHLPEQETKSCIPRAMRLRPNGFAHVVLIANRGRTAGRRRAARRVYNRNEFDVSKTWLAQPYLKRSNAGAELSMICKREAPFDQTPKLADPDVVDWRLRQVHKGVREAWQKRQREGLADGGDVDEHEQEGGEGAAPPIETSGPMAATNTAQDPSFSAERSTQQSARAGQLAQPQEFFDPVANAYVPR